VFSLAESSSAKRTVNPIRRIVDTIEVPKNDGEKELIPLSIGDPTTFGNLRTPELFVKAIQDAAADFSAHGYQHSAGMQAAREAVAMRHSRICGRNVNFQDVVIASGCSGALEIAIKGLVSEGEKLLIPRPGFAIYETLAVANGIQVGHYPLLPERSWEANLQDLEALVDERTRAILLNNPSNPCGSVLSKENLEGILRVAEKHHLAIISDEIYGQMTFKGFKFYPMASLTRKVPVIEVGGIAKEFLVPGFRIGWLIMHDVPALPSGMVLDNVRKGIMALTQLIIGGNTLVQRALPKILTPETEPDREGLEKFHLETMETLEDNARFFSQRLSQIHGLQVFDPQGAMYVMVGIDQNVLKMDDVTFAKQLLREQLVFVLPGSCFGAKNFFRVVFCAPKPILEDACNRIQSFVQNQQ